MRAVSLLLGCAVLLGSATVCEAADVNGADNATANAVHMSSDSSSHDAASLSDDAAELTRTRSTTTAGSSSSAAHSSSSSNSDDNAARGDDGAEHAGHRANLNWQSLLPGSIQ